MPPTSDDAQLDEERREFEAGFAAISADRPHDSLFRYAFGRVEHAASFLAAVLAPDLAAKIDWASLRTEPGTFVDERFVRRETDLLFTATWLGSSERVALYLLFEHQSTFDADALLRIAGYKVRIWSRFRERVPSASAPLPPILAVVLAHDTVPWRGPSRFSELTAIDDDTRRALGAHLLDFQIVLVDLASPGAEALLHERRLSEFVRFVLALFRMSRVPDDFVRALRPYAVLLGLLVRSASGRRDLAAFLRYLDAVGAYDSEAMSTLLRDSAGEPTARAVMTFSERMIEQGRAEGLAKGRAEGRAEALSRMLLLHLVHKFGNLPDSTRQRVARGSADELERWMVRILDADSLDDLFDREA